jgi:hypothetical protein
VIATTCHLNEPHVAFNHNRFREFVCAGEAEPRRYLAGIHGCAAGQIRVFSVVADEGVEVL